MSTEDQADPRTPNESAKLQPGEWFSVTSIVRFPNDGSFRGDLFRVEVIDGDFVACSHFSKYAGPAQRHSLYLPDYNIQKLSLAYVRAVRPEIAGAKEPAAATGA